MHSHLPSQNRISSINEIFNFSTFCIGSEDLSELETELSYEFDADKFELMLYTIDSLVSWESLEGGPYIQMDKIVSQSNQTKVNPSNSHIELIGEIFEEVIKKLSELPIDFVFVDGKYQIKNNTKFTDFVRNLILNKPSLSLHKKSLICKRGSNGDYYIDPRLSGEAENITSSKILEKMKSDAGGETPFIYMRGKKIHFNIHFLETTTLDINTFGVHPKFLTYVIEQLESKIYKACVRGSSINRLYNSGSHVGSISG